MSKDSAYLAAILSVAKAIRLSAAGVTKEQFLTNEEKYETVHREFEIISQSFR